MISKVVLQSVLGLGIAGGVATCGYFLLPESKSQTSKEKETPPKSMKELIDKEGWELLDTAGNKNDKVWEALVDKYHENLESDKKIKTDAIKPKTDTNKAENVKALKGECEKLIAKTKDFENEKNIAKDWCTQATTLINFETVNKST